MCLLTTNRGKTAKKPIKVYKLMVKERQFETLSNVAYDKATFNKFEYHFPFMGGGANIGDTVKAARDKKPCIIDFVYHYGKRVELYEIGPEGVHAYTTLEAAIDNSTIFNVPIITEWEIPIGAKYWYGDAPNRKNEIAATEMKFIGIIK